ncbi:MAG: threonine-phosphate decarboxylase CobD [Eubacteriales bacterium]
MATIGRIHGGNLREAAEKYGLEEKQFIDFSANVNPLGPSPRAIEAITSNLGAITHYPDSEAKVLRRAAAKLAGLPEEMIVVGNGAIEILYLLMKLLKPRRALIPAPTFNEYEVAVRINGGEVEDLFLSEGKGFAVDKEDIFRHWGITDVLFICNPNNPTGCLTKREDILEIIQKASKQGKTVVVDEAFMDFVADRAAFTVADLVPEYDNLFVLYSLTKFYAIPGLRLGLGLGSPQIIKKINEIRDPWNVNCFAQLAGAASLNDDSYISSTVTYVAKEKDCLFNRINDILGLRPFKPSVNYIFVNVKETGFSSTEISRMLGEIGILVRDCCSYKNLRPEYIRVAVRTREENNRLVAALLELGRK